MVSQIIIITLSSVCYFSRDNPAERLGYLRGGLKDIKSHRYAVWECDTVLCVLIHVHVAGNSL